MRFAVIDLETNAWVYDGDSRQDARREYERRAVNNVSCTLVQVLADTEGTVECCRCNASLSLADGCEWPETGPLFCWACAHKEIENLKAEIYNLTELV